MTESEINNQYKGGAFPLKKGNIELTSGTRTLQSGTVYWNVAASVGSLTVTWTDASSTVLSVPEGAAVSFDKYSLENVTSVQITAGTFHIG